MEARPLFSAIFPPEIVEMIESYIIPTLRKAASTRCNKAVVDSKFYVVYNGSHNLPDKYNTKRLMGPDEREIGFNYRPCHDCGEVISRTVVNRKQQETHRMCPYWVKLANNRFNKQGYSLRIFSEGRIAIATKPNCS